MTSNMESEYLLGTDDKERERLQLQHEVWKPETETLFDLSGFRSGQTLLDLGCGPGYTSFALAEIVGQKGEIIAVDLSSRYLDYFQEVAKERGFNNIRYIKEDVQHLTLQSSCVDGAFARCLLCFVSDAQSVVSNVARMLKPGGTFCVIDLFNYDAMTMVPKNDICDKLVRAVIECFRHSGGDSRIGERIPQLMHNAGLEIVEIRPISTLFRPGTPQWKGATMLVENLLTKVVASGHLSEEDRTTFTKMWSVYERNPLAFFVHPLLLGIIGQKL